MSNQNVNRLYAGNIDYCFKEIGKNIIEINRLTTVINRLNGKQEDINALVLKIQEKLKSIQEDELHKLRKLTEDG